MILFLEVTILFTVLSFMQHKLRLFIESRKRFFSSQSYVNYYATDQITCVRFEKKRQTCNINIL